jgi:hypothetical protein
LLIDGHYRSERANCGWCNIIVLNVHAPSEEKSDDVYENLEQVFGCFPKYNMQLLLDFNEKVRRERESIFKPTIGNENLH